MGTALKSGTGLGKTRIKYGGIGGGAQQAKYWVMWMVSLHHRQKRKYGVRPDETDGGEIEQPHGRGSERRP
jgi:hypothetical protein